MSTNSTAHLPLKLDHDIETDSPGSGGANWRKETIASAVNFKPYFTLKEMKFCTTALKKKKKDFIRTLKGFCFEHAKNQKPWGLAITARHEGKKMVT